MLLFNSFRPVDDTRSFVDSVRQDQTAHNMLISNLHYPHFILSAASLNLGRSQNGVLGNG